MNQLFNTHVLPSRKLRNNYAEISGLVNKGDQVIITNKGIGEMAIIPLNDFTNFQEYKHYKRFIAPQLEQAKKDITNPDTKWIEQEDVWSSLGV